MARGWVAAPEASAMAGGQAGAAVGGGLGGRAPGRAVQDREGIGFLLARSDPVGEYADRQGSSLAWAGRTWPAR